METSKNFRCKNEELIVICEYVQTALQRDLKDFTAYAPKFTQLYLTNFSAKTAAMRQLVFPHDKTRELKIVTARLYANMDEVADLLTRLEGYIKLSKNDIPLTVKDFGTAVLKQKIRRRDAEAVLQLLQQVNSNIEKYKEVLTKQGLPDESIKQLNEAIVTIATDNQKQYEIVSSRRVLTAENKNALNTLYEEMMDICEIGKILYRKSNNAKLPDYTFNYLMKNVRTEIKKIAAANEDNADAQ